MKTSMVTLENDLTPDRPPRAPIRPAVCLFEVKDNCFTHSRVGNPMWQMDVWLYLPHLVRSVRDYLVMCGPGLWKTKKVLECLAPHLFRSRLQPQDSHNIQCLIGQQGFARVKPQWYADEETGFSAWQIKISSYQPFKT